MASLKPRKENPQVKEVLIPSATNLSRLYDLSPPEILSDFQTDSRASSVARSSGSLSEKLINIDLGDFLTRRKTLASEKGHFVNAVRQDKTKARAGGRGDVASALFELGIIPISIADFSLEHYSNLICISDGLHPLFDRYGVFAYVPSDPMLDALIALVNKRNVHWQSIMNEYGPHIHRYARQLMDNIDDQLWDRFTYDIALLIPTHFLPFNQTLLIREPDDSYLYTKVLNKELCVVMKESSDDEPERVQPYILPPFQHQTTRHYLERLNPYLVCINAANKMAYHRRKYGVGTMTTRARALLEKAEQLVELLYVHIVPEPGTKGAELAAKEEKRQKEAEQQEKEGREKENKGREGRRERLRYRRSGSSGGSEASNESLPQASESGSDPDDIDDDDDELAFCAAIKDKLQSNDLTNRERMELGLRYLFGSKGYETPHIPGIPDPPSVFNRILQDDHMRDESSAEHALE